MKDERDTKNREATHPREVENAPGQRSLSYRVGDFGSFRKALLESLPTERDLRGYRPSAKGDLALAMLEWWAYLSDILTFYNERAANSSYLGTAPFDDEVARLVRLLGHRRQPGMGASATLAALVSAVRGMTLPEGMAIQSKPGPGEQPQIFELTEDVPAASGGAVPVDIVTHMPLIDVDSLLLKGTITSIKPGDWLLLTPAKSVTRQVGSAKGVINIPGATSKSKGVAKQKLSTAKALAGLLEQSTLDLFKKAKAGDISKGSADYQTLLGALTALLKSATTDVLLPLQVKSVAPEKDLRERPRTRIGLTAKITSLQGNLSQYQLLKGDSVLGLSPHAQTITALNELHLAARPPSMAVGEPIFIEDGPDTVTAAKVAKYFETVWNVPPEITGTVTAGDGTTQTTTLPMIVLHGVLQLETGARGETTYPSTKRVRYGFREVAALVEPELTGLVTVSELTLVPASSGAFPDRFKKNAKVLIEDATGVGALAVVDQVGASGEITVKPADSDEFSLTPPLRLLSNLFEVSRGATVAREVLGSGDASASGQSFELAKGPLTYFLPTEQGSGVERISTLTVYVNGVAWTEVSSFYGQASDAHVFVTREDASQKTWILFGDGVHGARLPTGTNNVVASYRYGSGKSAPAAGALTTLVSPRPGLVSVRNPVAAWGGADPESSSNMRKNATRAALALGRAVSADDYEAIAALVPGVSRARAAVAWDAAQQRALVTVWVYGATGIDKTVKMAIAAVADPNRPFLVKVAAPLQVALKITVLYDAATLPELVKKAVRKALLDEDTGIFGRTNTSIGAVIYKSRIHAACLVSGAVAIRDLSVTAKGAPSKVLMYTVSAGGMDAILDPGAERFISLDEADLDLRMEKAPNA